ncbi:MAG TPA: hypothetical protein VFB21_13920 [Chthonomonadaceae bacterium]|nr:hypothetical protein [Chthonomonadaceae bacterium]
MPEHSGDPRWRLSLGAFLPTDLPSGIDAREGYTLAIGGEILSDKSGCLLGSLRYSRYVATGGSNIGLLNPMLEYHWRIGEDRRFYIGPGIGFIFGDNSNGGTTSSFAYSLAAGVNFSSFFIEASWRRGTRDGEHGVAAEAGIRF